MIPSYEAMDESDVLTLEEIRNLTEGGRPADTLMNVVALIATRFRTDVCSAYLLEPDRSNLVLAATLGLHPRCIGTLRMPLNEGLTGLVAEQVLPVAVDDVQNHPRFKYFKESGEGINHSFLGVPLIDRGVLQGMLIVQTTEARVFQQAEIHLNKGHSGIAVFEAIRNRMQEEGMDFDHGASQIVREVVFTTHTPVPAGHDRFNADLLEEHLGPCATSCVCRTRS